MRLPRIIILTVLSLVAGLMVSIAVAAGCALWSRPPTEYSTVWKLERYPTEWILVTDNFRNLPPVDGAPERFARLEPLLPATSRSEAYNTMPPESVFCGIRVFESAGLEAEYLGLTWGTESLSRSAAIELLTVGWPMPCLSARRTTDQGFITFEPWTDAITPPAWLKPIAPQSPFDPARVIPTRPLAWGLSVNTPIYASGLLLMTTVPRPLIRRLRRRRNRCPGCNYDRSGLSRYATCPECGTNP